MLKARLTSVIIASALQTCHMPAPAATLYHRAAPNHMRGLVTVLELRPAGEAVVNIWACAHGKRSDDPAFSTRGTWRYSPKTHYNVTLAASRGKAKFTFNDADFKSEFPNELCSKIDSAQRVGLGNSSAGVVLASDREGGSEWWEPSCYGHWYCSADNAVGGKRRRMGRNALGHDRERGGDRNARRYGRNT